MPPRLRYSFYSLIILGLFNSFLDAYAISLVFRSSGFLSSILLLFLSSAFRLVSIVFETYLVKKIGHYLSTNVFKIICKPAAGIIDLAKPSSIITSLVFMIDSVGYNSLLSFIKLFTSVFSILSISFVILLFGGIKSILAILLIATYFIFTITITKTYLAQNSVFAKTYRESYLSTITETFSDYRRLLIDNLLDGYIRSYSLSDIKLRSVQSQNILLTSLPRYGFDLMLFSSLLIYVLFFSSSVVNINTLSGLGFSLFRLLPSFQLYSTSQGLIRAGSEAVTDILRWLNSSPDSISISQSVYSVSNYFPLLSITITDFIPKDSSSSALSFSIQVAKPLIITGPSGSGKTSLIDSILGIRRLSKHSTTLSFRHSEIPINTNHIPLFSYLSVSYSPQFSPLLNGDLFFNITLKEKNQASTADINSFNHLVARLSLFDLSRRSHLSHEINDISGGQRSRISIARALFKDSQLYIFDEPTASLDTYNASIVLSLLIELSASKCVAIISHDNKLISTFKSNQCSLLAL